MGKLSKYNIYLQKGENLHIANTLTGTMIMIPNHSKGDLLAYLDDKSTISKALCDNGIIIDNDIAETEIANLRYYEHVNQNDLHIVIMPTFDCNFKCKYCFETSNKLRLDHEIEEGIKNFLRVRSKKIKNLYITWFGGEPLLEIDKILSLMDYLQYLSRTHGFYLKQNMITNGFYLTAQLANKLSGYGCNNFQITLDGFKETHDYLRPLADGSGSFDQLISNLREIRKSTESRRLRILIRVNITKRLGVELKEFVDFLNTEFLCDSRFSVMWRRASDWEGSISKEMRQDLCGSTGWKYYINSLSECHPSWRGHISITKPFGSICGCVHRNFYAIGPDGQVFRCLSNMYTQDNTAVGYLKPTGEMVLNGAKVDNWKIKRESKTCQNCVVYPSCFSMNCPAQAVYNYKQECPRDKEILMAIVEGLAEESSLWSVLNTE